MLVSFERDSERALRLLSEREREILGSFERERDMLGSFRERGELETQRDAGFLLEKERQ